MECTARVERRKPAPPAGPSGRVFREWVKKTCDGRPHRTVSSPVGTRTTLDGAAACAGDRSQFRQLPAPAQPSAAAPGRRRNAWNKPPRARDSTRDVASATSCTTAPGSCSRWRCCSWACSATSSARRRSREVAGLEVGERGDRVLGLLHQRAERLLERGGEHGEGGPLEPRGRDRSTELRVESGRWVGR